MSPNGTEIVPSVVVKVDIAEAVHRQLESILEHSLFVHSRRFPALLRYVVEQALEGNTDHIKERSIGVLVFGRSPTYDTNADPIVRVTAGEIRKRLQQFYREPEHTDDLRIVLPLGSYVPHFLNDTSRTSLKAPGEIEPDEREPEVEGTLEESPNEGRPAEILLSLRHLYFTVLAILLIACLSGWLGYRIHNSHDASNGLLRQFWSSGSVPMPLLVCLPDISKKPPVSPALFTRTKESGDITINDHFGDHQAVARADMLAVTRLARAVDLNGRSIHIRMDSEINLDDLRETPVVLIGSFDNQWTIRALQQTPFRFKLDITSHRASIVDMRTPSTMQWILDTNTPSLKISRDYAIVAHYADLSTGQVTVVLAGIGDNGTEAAAELLCSESGLAELSRWLKESPAKTNFEAIVSTEVVVGKSGPPTIVTATKW